jgi:hypothetical protein
MSHSIQNKCITIHTVYNVLPLLFLLLACLSKRKFSDEETVDSGIDKWKPDLAGVRGLEVWFVVDIGTFLDCPALSRTNIDSPRAPKTDRNTQGLLDDHASVMMKMIMNKKRCATNTITKSIVEKKRTRIETIK